MFKAVIELAVLALLLGGCVLLREARQSDQADPGTTGPPDASQATPSAELASPERLTPEPSDAPGSPVPRSDTPRPTLSAQPLQPTALDSVISGTLGADSIEGGCWYLEALNGTRYQVIYPDGWRMDSATARLTGPRGELARPGDTITVRGAVVTDMASTCQIGPMFRAIEVVGIEG